MNDIQELTLYLDPQIVRSVLGRHYPHVVNPEEKYEVEWAGGFRGHNFKLTQNKRTFLLKIYRDRNVLPWNNFTVERLEAIFQVQRGLRQRGFPVQVLLETSDGKNAGQVYLLRMHFSIMLSFLEGEHVERELVGEKTIEVLGETFSGVVRALGEIDSPAEISLSPEEQVLFQLDYFHRELPYLITKYRDLLAGVQIDALGMLREWEGFRKGLRSSLSERGERGTQLVHADLTPHNVLFGKGGEVSGILDFDKTHLGFLEEEIGVAVASWSNYATEMSAPEVYELLAGNLGDQVKREINERLVLGFAGLYLWAELSFAFNKMMYAYNIEHSLSTVSHTWDTYQELQEVQ